MELKPKPVIFKSSQQRSRDVAVYPIPPGNDTCYKFSYLNKNKAGDVHIYLCTACRSERNQKVGENHSVIATVRVRNKYCQYDNKSSSLESAAATTFFRRLQVLPFMPSHLSDLSGVLEPTREHVVDVAIEQGLHDFMEYFNLTWLPSNDEFCQLWDHSRNYSTRTTNYERHPLMMLKSCAAELTIAKTLAISIGNGSFKDRYIRPDEEDHQKDMLYIMQNFHQHIVQTVLAGVILSTRKLKQYFDNLVTNLTT
uniref:Polycomb protein Asx n=1 Tax=Heterorhabditis bacteriophora TaxID=37862 RepID=A0A1I7WN98_HETBA